MTFGLDVRLAALKGALFAALLAGGAAAQEPATAPSSSTAPNATAESSPAAITQYSDAVALQNRGLYDLAADEWRKFLDRFASDPLAGKAQHYLGICRLQLKQYDAAISAFDRAIENQADRELLPSTYLNLGLAQYAAGQAGNRGRYAQAVKTLSTLVEKFPKSDFIPQAVFYLGEAQYGLEKKREAAQLYERYLKENPKGALRPDALYALGVALQELNNPSEAGAHYDALLKQFPGHALRAEIIMRRAETLFAQRKFAAAAKWFHSAAGHPNFALADYAVLREAASHYENKDYAQAAATYARLLEKHPSSNHTAVARLAAGKCYYLAGDAARAEQWLNQVVAGGGEAAVEAAHWLARVLLNQDRAADALALIEKASAQPGQSSFAPNILLDHADAAYKVDRRSKNIPALYAAVAEQYPKSSVAPQALYMAAFSALGMGNHAAAARYAEQFMNTQAGNVLAPDVTFIAAEAHIQLGSYAKAAELYRDLIGKHAAHRDRPTWQLRHALALALNKKHAEVIAAIAPAISLLKDKSAIAEANYLVGNAQLELKQHEAAVESLAASLAADPTWRQADETLFALAAAHRQLGDIPRASAALDKLIAEFPRSNLLDRSHYRRGEYAYTAGDYRLAATEYELLLSKWPTSGLAPSAIFGLAWAQLGQKQYDQAEKTFTGLLTSYPAHALAARAHVGRATARQQLKQFAAALDDLSAREKAAMTAREKAELLYLKGLCLVGLKQPESAVEAFRAAIAAGPEGRELEKLQYELAWALKAQNKEAEATEAFTKLASLKSQSPLALEALYHVADAKYSQGQYQAAAEIFGSLAAKATTPELAEKAAHKLAWAQFEQQDYAGAEKSFAAQLARWPQGELAAEARFMIAESLFKAERFADAQAAFDRSLERPPAAENSRVLALLHAAQCAAQLKKWPDASRLLARALKDFPQTQHRPEITYEQGWALQNQSQVDEALRLYDQVAAQTQREVGARARFMMGEIFFERRDHKEAIRNYFKVAYGYGYPQSPEPIRKWQASSAYEAARCFEVLKMVDQAKKSYREVVDKYPKSDKAALAKGRLEALGA